jgi:hypothetical protein
MNIHTIYHNHHRGGQKGGGGQSLQLLPQVAILGLHDDRKQVKNSRSTFSQCRSKNYFNPDDQQVLMKYFITLNWRACEKKSSEEPSKKEYGRIRKEQLRILHVCSLQNTTQRIFRQNFQIGRVVKYAGCSWRVGTTEWTSYMGKICSTHGTFTYFPNFCCTRIHKTFWSGTPNWKDQNIKKAGVIMWTGCLGPSIFGSLTGGSLWASYRLYICEEKLCCTELNWQYIWVAI